MGGSKRKGLKRVILVAVFSVVTVVGYWVYQNFGYYSGSFIKPANFQELVDNWAEQDNIPGVILRIDKNQETIFETASGTITLKEGEPLSPSTPFHTASVGKIFTTLTLLKLHEQGVLSIDEPIAPYVDEAVLTGLVQIEGIDYSKDLTFRQLITHRGGLPNTDVSLKFQYWVLSKRDRKRLPSELINFARGMKAVGKPDELTSYSSVGYFLLGLAIEGVTAQPYHEVVRRELLDPLGMSNTYESNHELPPDLKTSHHYFGYIDLADNTDPSFEFADGGFVTTTDDLITLGQAIVQASLFDNPETRSIFDTPLDDGAGFGYYWAQTEDGLRYMFQPGFWGVRFAVFPDHNMIIVFTLNQSNTLTQKFSNQLIELLVEGNHL